MARKKTEKQLAKDKAWKAFSAYIRKRDCLRFTGKDDEGMCVTCKRWYPRKSLQAGHFIGGRTNAVLFNERIVYSQCYGCNVGRSGNYLEYYYFMVDELGSRDAVDELVAKLKQINIKYTLDDYKKLEQHYLESEKKLKKPQPNLEEARKVFG